MKELSIEELRTESKNISDNKIGIIFTSVIHKQLIFVHKNNVNLERENKLKYFMYKHFANQFNTAVRIAMGLNYLDKENTIYFDSMTFFAIIRSCMERYLAFWLLDYHESESNIEIQQEISFRYLCFQYSACRDCINISKTFPKIKRTNQSTDISTEIQKMKNIKNEIINHKYYLNIKKDRRERIIKYGDWKILSGEILNWMDLIRASPLDNGMGLAEYSYMSNYTHASPYGIRLAEGYKNNTGDDLFYLYAICAMFVYGFDQMCPGSTENFDKYEIAISQEFHLIATKGNKGLLEII